MNDVKMLQADVAESREGDRLQHTSDGDKSHQKMMLFSEENCVRGEGRFSSPKMKGPAFCVGMCVRRASLLKIP